MPALTMVSPHIFTLSLDEFVELTFRKGKRVDAEVAHSLMNSVLFYDSADVLRELIHDGGGCPVEP